MGGGPCQLSYGHNSYSVYPCRVRVTELKYTPYPTPYNLLIRPGVGVVFFLGGVPKKNGCWKPPAAVVGKEDGKGKIKLVR